VFLKFFNKDREVSTHEEEIWTVKLQKVVGHLFDTGKVQRIGNWKREGKITSEFMKCEVSKHLKVGPHVITEVTSSEPRKGASAHLLEISPIPVSRDLEASDEETPKT